MIRAASKLQAKASLRSLYVATGRWRLAATPRGSVVPQAAVGHSTNQTLLLLRDLHTRQPGCDDRYTYKNQGIGHVFPTSVAFGGPKPRFFSSDSTDGASGESSSLSPDVDATLEKLFQENQQWVDGAGSAASATAGGMDFVPTWYNPADQCLQLMMKTAEMTGWDLGMTIIAVTAIARTVIFPLVVMGQRSSSRMAHVQPELQLLKQRFERLGSNPSTEQKLKFGKQVQELFKRYDVHPMRSFLPPVVQLPFFMGMFFGLKKMPDYFPQEMMTGGMLWFPDLTQSDPLYILPLFCTASFFATVELGKEQMMASNPQHAGNMLNLFRGLSLLMLPVCINFHAGMLCYWTVTNVFTLTQIGVMKIPAIKKAFGIWDPPKPVPGLHAKDEGFMKAAQKLMDQVQGNATSERDKIKKHNERLELENKVENLSKTTREGRRRAIKKRG